MSFLIGKRKGRSRPRKRSGSRRDTVRARGRCAAERRGREPLEVRVRTVQMFAVAGIPLDSIYTMATPLHSQNYLDIGNGILRQTTAVS